MNRTCDSLRADLSAHLDGELGPEDRRRIEAHLEGCAGCRRVLDQWERIGSTLAGFCAVPSQAGSLYEQVLDRVRREAAPRGNVVPWFALPSLRWAAVLVAVLCGVLAAWLALPGRSGGDVVFVGGQQAPEDLPERGLPMYVAEWNRTMAAPAPEGTPTTRDGPELGYRWAADEIDASRGLRSDAALADAGVTAVGGLRETWSALSAGEAALAQDRPVAGDDVAYGRFSLESAEPLDLSLVAAAKEESRASEAAVLSSTHMGLASAASADGEAHSPAAMGALAAASPRSDPGYRDLHGDSRLHDAPSAPGVAGGVREHDAFDTAVEGQQSPGRLKFVAIDADWALNYTQTVAHDLDGEVLALDEHVCPSGDETALQVLLPADNVERFVFALEANNVRVVDWELPEDPDAEDLRAEGLLPPRELPALGSGRVAPIDRMAALEKGRSPAPGGIPARSGGVILRSLDAGDREGPGRPRLQTYCVEIEGVGAPGAGPATVH